MPASWPSALLHTLRIISSGPPPRQATGQSIAPSTSPGSQEQLQLEIQRIFLEAAGRLSCQDRKGRFNGTGFDSSNSRSKKHAPDKHWQVQVRQQQSQQQEQGVQHGCSTQTHKLLTHGDMHPMSAKGSEQHLVSR